MTSQDYPKRYRTSDLNAALSAAHDELTTHVNARMPSPVPLQKIIDLAEAGGTDVADAPSGSCPHTPTCPVPSDPDREAAHVIVSHPEQGWSLLCNGVVIFEDTGELLPDGASIAPHRPTDLASYDRPVGVTHGRGQVPASPSSEQRTA